MEVYKNMYLKLFNEVTNAVEILQNLQANSLLKTGEKRATIEAFEVTPIIEQLQNIQATTEDMFIDSEQ